MTGPPATHRPRAHRRRRPARRAGQGADPRRGAAVARALPRRPRRGQVRRQRHDRRRPQGRLRPGHRLPPVCRPAPRRRARRRSADRRHARPARARERVQGRPAGDHARGHGRRADGPDRPGRPRARRACSTSTARSRWASPARTPACSARAGAPRSSTASRSTSASSATSRRSTRRRSSDILDAGRIPVVSTVAPDLDVDGQVLNVNADTAAAALAVALGATKLVVLTDVEGVYADWPDRDSLLSELSAAEARSSCWSRVDAGMIPKLEACLRAVEGGVPAGPRHRRPPAALAAPRGLHLRGNRHHDRSRRDRGGGSDGLAQRRAARPLPAVA